MSQNILEEMEIMHKTLKEHYRVQGEIANLITQSAKMGLTSVDSRIILDTLDEHYKRLHIIQKRLA